MNIGAWFARRPPLSAEDRARLQREREQEREQREAEARRDAAAQAHREREAEEARFEAERARESAARIEAACRAVGFWFPGMPIPESRLSGRLTWRERAIENIRESWRELTRQ